MKHSAVVRITLLLLAALFGAGVVQAQDLATVRDRMEKRLPAILALMNRQVAGENNRGYLEVRGGVVGEDQQIISEENSDRQKVYAALAKKTGESIDEVGRQRAVQLAARAKRGHWIQGPAGDWRQK